MTPTASGHAGWSATIDDLAARASRWVALEELLFATLGAWARSVPESRVKRVFGTWCHRHHWHAELWRARVPAMPARTDAPDPFTGVAEWIAPLQRVLADPATATTTAAKLAVISGPVLDAIQSGIDDQRAVTDRRLDGPTARIVDLLGADLAAERADLQHAAAAPLTTSA